MPKPDQYLAILRCQTWNVWPEKIISAHSSFQIDYGFPAPLTAELIVLSYENRTAPEYYLNEETKVGPLIWDGAIQGLYHVRDMLIHSPDEQVKVELQYRNSQRGEVDICLRFEFTGELPLPLVEAIRSSASAVMSLLNLRLQDCLTPAAPFQVSKLTPNGGEMDTTLSFAVQNRQLLADITIDATLSNIVDTLLNSTYGEKLRIALELYAAHFNERQARVRFLLLVIAIESLAKATTKHQVAIDVLARWQDDLVAEKLKYTPSSEQFLSLDALSHEIGFRAEDSIRSQVRKLFANLNGIDSGESSQLQRRALYVYDRRSTLVHDGYLPMQELSNLEKEARELLEKVFLSTAAGKFNTSPQLT